MPPPTALLRLLPRQSSSSSTTTNTALPFIYSGLLTDPSPGSVVGILLGSIAGFLLLIWLLNLCYSGRSSSTSEDDLVVRTARHSQASRRSHSPPRRRSRSIETVDVRRAAPHVERIIVDERREERDSDIIEVFEESTPPRRSRSGREREGAYRTVVPDEYAGGNRPAEEVYRKSSKRSTRRG